MPAPYLVSGMYLAVGDEGRAVREVVRSELATGRGKGWGEADRGWEGTNPDIVFVGFRTRFEGGRKKYDILRAIVGEDKSAPGLAVVRVSGWCGWVGGGERGIGGRD